MTWTEQGGSFFLTRERKRLELRKHVDGTWRLLVWKEKASAIAGVFGSPETGKHAGETMDLDEESIARACALPYAQIVVLRESL
jgi:hypothetical protein